MLLSIKHVSHLSEFRARQVTNPVSYHVSSNAVACLSRLDNVSSKHDTLWAMLRIKIKTISSPLEHDLIMRSYHGGKFLKKNSIREPWA